MNSVFTDAAETESIVIMQPIIICETKITSENIHTLLNNLDEGYVASSDPESAEGSWQQIIIREFQMVDSPLNFMSALVSAPITLSGIEIRDIEAESGTASAANAVRGVCRNWLLLS